MSDQHTSAIKTPRQLITLIILAFVIPILLIILLVKYVATDAISGAGSASMTPEAVADRLAPIGSVVLGAGGGGAAKVLQSGDAVYKQVCAVCHDQGVANAPKTGDAVAWGPRLKQGFDVLVKHAVEGFNTMPPRGGNMALDPVEVARAVAFLGNKAGASFTEPAAPAAPVADAAPASTPGAAAPAAVAPGAVATVAAPASAGGGEKLYRQACFVCHDQAVAGAPKLGDKAAWAPRIATGGEALLKSVIGGKNAMPPRGTAMAASDSDLKAAIEFMVSQAK